jgi:hypothetical protein
MTAASRRSHPIAVSAIISRNRLAASGTISILPPPNQPRKRIAVDITASAAAARVAAASL